MKKFWIDKDKCTACGACENVCPKNAIHMETDRCGFKYPVISEKCIECNLCEKVCNRRLELRKNEMFIPKIYAAWSLNPNIRYHSTSGGVFSELAMYILAQNGYASGVRYNESKMAVYTLISNTKDLEYIRQSKYLQSDVGMIYQKIKTKLKNNEKVIFCGAPCQVAGLYAYLNKEYDNLLTIDFICRGMNSPKAYFSWLRELEIKNKHSVERVWFKYKKDGWKNSPLCTKIDFDDNYSIVLKGDENLFMYGYLGPNLYIRPCCGDCDFKGIPRLGDITLADFWGIEKALDDDKGTSLVMLNNQKGQEIFDKIKSRLFCQERSLEETIEGNVCLYNSVEVNPRSREFLEHLDNVVFSKAIQKYVHISVLKKIKRKVKRSIIYLRYKK